METFIAENRASTSRPYVVTRFAMTDVVPDSEYTGLLAIMPPRLRAYILLARFDRPIGWWLLFWPCLFGMALGGGLFSNWPLVFWFMLGAVAMRGAGCVYNDILDRDLDAQVARTASRPLASGAVSLTAAWIWLGILCLIGLYVLLQLRFEAQLVAVASLALVAAYPIMKRITWWPQAWLGLVFSWGALIGWLAVGGEADAAMYWLYAGTVFWVIGFDTIYAMQDREDDVLIGIRSSALRLGSRVKLGVAIFYALAFAGWAMAIFSVRPQGQAVVAILPMGLHLAWQVYKLRQDGSNALQLFWSNRAAGILALVGFFVVGAAA